MMQGSSILDTGDLPAGEVRRLLEEKLLPKLSPESSIETLKIERQRFTPGKECTVSGSIDLSRGAAAENNARFILSYVRRKTLNKMRRRIRQAPGGGNEPLVIDEDSGLIIEVFPDDWRLPALRSALDASEASQRLDPLRPLGNPTFELKLLRYRPHMRALLSYVFRDGQGQETLDSIGKIYGEEDKAEDAWNALEFLAKQAGPTPVTPKPLHYVPEWRMVVMQRVPGKPLLPLLVNSPAQEARDATRLTAQALTRFHSFELEREDTRFLADELIEVRDQASKFSTLAGWLSDEAFRLMEKAEAVGSSLGKPPTSLVHGAFKPEQMIIGDASAVIVDLDGTVQGDAALDLGNYAAKQFKDARDPSRAHLDAMGQALMENYLSESADPSIGVRCRLFESLALTRLAFRELHTERRDLAEQRDASPSGRLISRARERMEEVESQ